MAGMYEFFACVLAVSAIPVFCVIASYHERHK